MAIRKNDWVGRSWVRILVPAKFFIFEISITLTVYHEINARERCSLIVYRVHVRDGFQTLFVALSSGHRCTAFAK